MRSTDPSDRTSLEVQILSYLNDVGHPEVLSRIIDVVSPHNREVVICTTENLRREGLLTELQLADGWLITLTPQGKEILFAIYSGRNSCD